MPYFVVHALDAANMIDVRTKERAAHRARLRDHEHALKVHIGGPLLDNVGQMCGTMLIIEANRRADVEAYIADDPYTRAGVYADISIHPYLWGLGQPEGNDG